MEQYVITLTSSIAIFLSQSTNCNLSRYACFFGLAGQPFWMFTAMSHDQWGIFMSSIVFTCAWLKGLMNHWFVGSSLFHK